MTFFTGGSEAMRITTDRKVGIGTISPVTQLDVNKNIFARPTTTAEASSVKAVASDYLSLPSFTNTGVAQYGSTATGTTAGLSNASLGILEFINTGAALIYTNGSAPIVFGTTSTERARIDSSGRLLVGTTTAGFGSQNGFSVMNVADSTYLSINHANGTVTSSAYIGFSYNGATIGSVTQSGTTAVAYNTSSDYRLKENVAPMAGALAKVAQLKPCTFTWKADGSDGQGFIAHELQAVVPDCVTGTKDAVDAEGNPQYQGVDTSFLVATLTAAIQEQQALIQDLTARLTALEGN
jgi:hypothetical protein